jgi:hypothetical protein
MGQPRATRRRVITISSDNEDDQGTTAPLRDPSEDDEPVKPQKRSTGKLKPVKKVTKALSPEPDEDSEPIRPQERGTGKLQPVKKTSKVPPPTPSSSNHNGGSQKSPAKVTPKAASKTKSKIAVKDQSKTNGQTIHSFFNAATQKQQFSQPSPSPDKLSVTHAPLEAIQDDSDEHDGVSLAKGSSTALAMRKRKVQLGGGFGDDYVSSQQW